MGGEVVGTDMGLIDVDMKADMDNSVVHVKENGKLDDESVPNQVIKFGSHEEPAKGEIISVSDSNLPKDAVDEWPAIKQIHSFYFVRLRPYDDPKIKAKIEQADKEIAKRNQARLQITDELRAKRSERAELKNQVRALISDSQKYRAIMDEKKRELGPLQQALGKLRNTNSSNRGGTGLCSSEEELNDLIYSLQYRIQHESIPLSEEKLIMREIKQLEGTRAQVIAHAALRAKIEDSMGQKDAIQDQVKLMGVDLDGVRKEQQAVSSRITLLDEKVKAVDKDINALQEELDIITQKRDEAFETIRGLRTQRDQGNALFYQSRALLTKAKELAAKKDIKGLEELSNAEVEKFVSLWSSSKTFRDDYEKRILPSLDSRQLSRDGRIRNPDEKPILAPEVVQAESEPLAKANAKRPKEDAKPAPQKDTPEIPKKETGKKDSAVTVENVIIDDKPTGESVKQPQNSPAEKIVDKEKLKEIKREEEMAKAKQAMERKKKLAEKAMAKAAVKAQKEAEKKLKDREKKLKKKAAASAPANEPDEPAEAAVEGSAEPENMEVKEEAQPLAKGKVIRSNERPVVRYRNRPKGGEPLPKAILRKKKSNNYWVWAAAVAALVLLLMVLGYFYMF